MTNGEKLIRDFPYIEIKGQDEVFTAIQIDTTGTGTPIIVYTEWWNSEYKELTTKNDLDCISRKELDKALYKRFHEENSPNNITDVHLGTVRNFIKNFPSATLIRPKGHWIEYSWNDNGLTRWGLECDKCHKKYKYGGEIWNNPYFCPNCGADMREVEG